MITFDEKRRIFKIDAGNTSYAIKISEGGYLLHLYYGKKLAGTDLDFLCPITTDVSFSPREKSEIHDPDFSTDIKPMEYSVNGTGDYRTSYHGFGGYKMSGVGREGALHTLEEFSEVKTTVLRGVMA